MALNKLVFQARAVAPLEATKCSNKPIVLFVDAAPT